MDPAESQRVLEEIRRDLGHLDYEEEATDTNSVIADRVFANFMHNSMIEIVDEFSPGQ